MKVNTIKGKKIAVEVELPSLPNFLKINGNTTSIANIDDANLRAIGKEWTRLLLESAAEKRKLVK